MKRLFAGIASATLVLLALSAGPALAYGEPTGPNRVAVGGSGTYVFENIPSDISTIDVAVDGPGDALLVGLVTRSYPVVEGIATVRIVFPVTGAYVVTGTGTGPSSGSFSHTLTVEATVATADDGDPLAPTGVDAAPYLWFGGGALALGVAILLILRSGRRSGGAKPTT